jgi:hypothetical protein
MAAEDFFINFSAVYELLHTSFPQQLASEREQRVLVGRDHHDVAMSNLPCGVRS